MVIISDCIAGVSKIHYLQHSISYSNHLMKTTVRPFFITLLAIGCLYFFSGLRTTKQESRPTLAQISFCGSLTPIDSVIRPVVLHAGFGNLSYAISTRNVQAQRYFDQGLRLIYAFNHVEALRSFQEAARLDPTSAMTYWGQALALGPNLNDWNPADREAEAFRVIKKAMELAKKSPANERDLIYAMAARYDGQAHTDRSALNEAYAVAMESVANKYPNDPEALTLYADAVMITMPWNYWNPDGTPKATTSKARKALETVLAKYPNHPGAHHLFIHLVEASGSPDDALPSAEFLETAMPASGHLVHMPAHIYIRTGDYNRSNLSNIAAIQADEVFLSASEDQGMYRVGYYPHNIDFLVYGSMMNGQSENALRNSMKLVYQLKPMEKMMPAYYDFFMTSPVQAMVRYGQWNEILTLPQPDKDLLQSAVVSHFARGIAFLRKDKLDDAQLELAKLESYYAMDTLKTIYGAFNSAHQLASIATHLLKGELMTKLGNAEAATRMYELAIQAEDTLRYNEPPDWRLPSRHFLGAALLEIGKYEEAEKVFLEDLRRNPENGWSLRGLMASLEKQNKTSDITQLNARFNKVWKEADVEISSSRY